MANKLAILVGSSLAAASLLSAAPASAGVRIHFGGGVHVRGHVGGSIRWSRPAPVWRPAPRPFVSGSIYVGRTYNTGYYPGGYVYPTYAPAPVVPSYYPVAPATQGYYAAAAAAPAPQLSRFAVGVFAGGVATETDAQGDDMGLLARVRVAPHFLIEGELGRSRMADGAREDRRLEGAAVYETHPYHSMTPYIVAGIGAQDAQVGNTWTTTQQFGEIGAGLRWQLSPSLQLLGDIRFGQRSETDAQARPTDVAARAIAPQADAPEGYSRVRLAAALTF